MIKTSSDSDVLFSYAVSLHDSGRVKEAIALYKQLLNQFPNSSEILTPFGIALVQFGSLSEGIKLLEKSLEISPDQPTAYFYMGNILYSLKRFDEALLNHDQAIALKSDFAEAYCNRGVVLSELERFDEALLSYDQAIILKPGGAETYYNRALALNELKRSDEAILSYDQAISLKPDYAEAYSNRAHTLITLKQFNEALVSCDRAIALNTNLAEAYNNRGVALCELKRFDEAVLSHDQAIALQPNFAKAYWNKSWIKLTLGDYKLGWELYEWRWKSPLKKYVREFLEPLWLGDSSVSGKTLLIYAEQGFGDVIQFCRYVLMAKDLGANIILEVQPPLVLLMSTLNDDIIIVEKGESLPDFDLQCPIMSLPLAFKTAVESIPASIPYLFCDPNKQKIWKERLGVKTKKRIGLVCSGAVIHKDDMQRSIPLHLFRSLLNLPFEFHLLQKEIRSGDEAFLAEFPSIKTHQENLIDFSDTAALIKEMDLVISVDTSVVHLAGALGCPVWVLLPWKPDWRWFLDRTDSPWYPTATLLRQPEMGNWESVVTDVCQRLSDQESAVYFHKGNVLNSLKRFDEALLSYENAIALKSDYAEAYCNRGVILGELKRFDEAVLSYDQAISLNPNIVEAYYNRGVALNELKRFDEAILSYDQAISLKPDYAESYCNRGVALENLKRFDEALLNHDCTIALNPNIAESYSNRGIILNKLQRFDEAMLSYNEAIALKPNYAESYANRASTLVDLKQFNEALADCDYAITFDPNCAKAYWNKSWIKLTLGDYELGWELYEWRWKSYQKEYVREFLEPLWLGETSISGKTVLIYDEQGLGDVIQFCRYVLMVKDLGAKVIFEVPSSLFSLMSTLNDDIIIVEKGEPFPAFDLQCPIMSLPLAFKTTVEAIPVNVPYLFSDPKKTWKKRLGTRTKKRIGLVCSGSTHNHNDIQRSISLHLFKPLLELPFEFHLLQKEIRSDDEIFLAENSQIQIHHEDLVDFSDTAALIKEMDLVISVDTSVAHLAGALGCPVWILIAWKPDWRWLLDRTDSPWYPTATLFRQPEMGNWESVIADVCQRLSNQASAAYFHEGNVLNSLKRFDEALLIYENAIALKSDYAEAYCNRGVVLNELKRFDEAVLNYGQAISLKPNYVEAYSNQANSFISLKQFDKALVSCDYAIALNPDFAEAYCNRGSALENLKRSDEALISCDRAISLKPNFAEAYWNKSLTKLSLGDYKLGWELYEWRWKSYQKEHVREFSEPLWLGETSISGKTVLIYDEQGLGDVIQFCRYVLMVKDLEAKVIFEVPSSLFSLMSTLNDDIIIVEKGESLPAFDFQCPIMSLPLAFKTTVEGIPVNVPYLFSDPKKTWKQRLGIKTKKRIGLVCSGSTLNHNDIQRSIPLNLFKPLLELPFEFHLLQKEIRSDDETFLSEHSQIQTHQENLIDFSDTAALIKEMDLVISVDTSVAHLSGALGHPVLVLLPWKAEWRWLLDRTDSPWYPTAILFRQPEMGNWESVIADVCQRLSSDPSATKDTLVIENDTGLSC
jgi:tetratricopeptide (TPR) repeat protein